MATARTLVEYLSSNSSTARKKSCCISKLIFLASFIRLSKSSTMTSNFSTCRNSILISSSPTRSSSSCNCPTISFLSPSFRRVVIACLRDLLKLSIKEILSVSSFLRMEVMALSKSPMFFFFKSYLSLAFLMKSSESALNETRKASTNSLVPGKCFNFSKSGSSANISSNKTWANIIPDSSSCFRYSAIATSRECFSTTTDSFSSTSKSSSWYCSLAVFLSPSSTSA